MRGRVRLALVGSLLVALASACGESSGPWVGGETHWIQCDSNADCIASLKCICGLCAPPCEADSACVDLRGPSVCWPTVATSETGSCQPAPSGATQVCLPECSDATDCQYLGDDLRCEGGVCRADTRSVDLDLGGADTPEPDLGAEADAPDLEPTVTLVLRFESHGTEYLSANWGDGRSSGGFPFYQSVDRALQTDPPAPEPVPDVLVAIASADRVSLDEAQSDSDGRVAFDVPEDAWPVSVTAYIEGYTMLSVAEIAMPASADPIALTLYPYWTRPENLVRIEGTTRRSHANNALYVNTMRPFGAFYWESSDSWNLEVPAGTPIDLVAADLSSFPRTNGFDRTIHQAAFVSYDGVEEPTTLEIDFATDEVETSPIAGAYELPERETTPLRQAGASPALWILALGNGYWTGAVGVATTMRLDGDFIEYTAELIEVSGYDSFWTEAWIDTASGWSMAFGRGAPADRQPRLLDLPMWVSESQGGQGFPIAIGKPLSWEIFDEDVATSVLIERRSDIVWVVQVPNGATEVFLPPPPSNVDLDELLGTSPSAVVTLERRIDIEEGVFHLVSWGTTLELDLGE